MNKKTAKRLSLVSVFLALLIFTVSCEKETSGRPDTEAKAVRKVRVMKAVAGTLPRAIEVSGTLAAEQEVVLSLKAQGRIGRIFADLGSRVRRGQSLLELEPADFQLRVQQAQASYEQARVRLGLTAEGAGSAVDPEQTGVVRAARAQLDAARLNRDRRESLFKQGLLSHSEFDDAEAAYQVASARYQDALEEVRNRQAVLIQRRAELDLARQQLADSVLRAPLDGAVQQRSVSQGQFVNAGEPAFTLVKMHPLRLKLSVPEREARDVHTGQNVEVRVEGDPAVYPGIVARLSPGISAENRTLMLEAEIPNESGALRPGSFARARIITQPGEPAVLIPATAVITFAGIQKVISVSGNQTVEKRIQTGRRSNDMVEVTEGLTAGEPVVLEPGTLTGGVTVVVIW